jgi:hypothetical protein
MKVSTVINMLSTLNPDDEVVIDWWTQEWFEEVAGKKISPVGWQWVVSWARRYDEEVSAEQRNILLDGLADWEKRNKGDK